MAWAASGGHAHTHRIMHRDFNPFNVFATADVIVKLLDFGVAKLLEVDAGSGARRTMQLSDPAAHAPKERSVAFVRLRCRRRLEMGRAERAPTRFRIRHQHAFRELDLEQRRRELSAVHCVAQAQQRFRMNEIAAHLKVTLARPFLTLHGGR